MDGNQVIAVVGIAAGVLGGLGGTYLGWRLSKSLSAEITESEREYQEKQTVRLREEAAAEQLRDAVIEIQGKMPAILMDAREAAEPLRASNVDLWRARTRASVLRDSAIEERFSAADMAIFIATHDAAQAAPDVRLNFWSLGEGLAELRKALDAFVRREPPPQFVFPTAGELIEISGSSGVGIDKIHEAVIRRKIDDGTAAG